MAEYLHFVETKRKPKTRTWEVWSRPEEERGKSERDFGLGPVAGLLGNIQWFGAWRCYAFYPRDSTIFEKTCLRAIAHFLEEQTTAARASWKKPSAKSASRGLGTAEASGG